MADTMPAMTPICEEMGVFVNECVAQLLFVLDDRFAEANRADAVIGHPR
jgi:hypothetical protein